MSTEKLTAVEWLMREFQEVGYISLATYSQAKEMEKEQMKKERVEAYNNGYANGQKDAYTD